MLHDELLYTHSSGLADTKATWLACLRSGKTKYKSAACSDRKVRLAGDTALVTGRAAIEAARVPQRLDKNAQGLEIHRVAVDAAAHHVG